ncbi:MAG: hypothetical protein V8Q75_03200 [Bacilli bacterium]
MLKMIIEYLPYLGLAVLFNVLMGSYNNIAKLRQNFSWKRLLEGLAKALIVAICFIAFATIYDKVFGVIKVGDFDIKPDIIILSSIVLYTTKGVNNLLKILGLNKDNMVEIEKKETIELPLENEIK